MLIFRCNIKIPNSGDCMKKYRCPHCGAECITLREKVYYFSPFEHYRQGNACSECTGRFGAVVRRHWWAWLCEVVNILLVIGVPVALMFGMTKSLICIPLLFLYLIVLFFVIMPLFHFHRAIVRFDPSIQKCVYPVPNAGLVLDSIDGKIRDLDIYGIRFEKTTPNAKFHEVFSDGLVPVIFRVSELQAGKGLGAVILKPEWIPEELLVSGAAFSVVDNGKIIAHGAIRWCDPSEKRTTEKYAFVSGRFD